MKITLCRATKEDKDTIQNLGRFYVYEMSRYCGFLPTWGTPPNGLFKCIDLSSYCEKPDKMNYAALSNTSPVIHMHIIPRYKVAREFNGISFKDARWGQNYAPYDCSFSINESILFKIRDDLKGQL